MAMLIRFVAATAALALATPASAAIVLGAAKVRITSALPNWLQVGEVQATQLGTGVNVALATNGGTAVGSGDYTPASNPGKAIDGIAPASYSDIYHSDGAGSGEFLDITFANPTDLASLTVFGRVDCCSDRDFYNVSIFNSSGAVIFSGQLDNRQLAGGGNTILFDQPSNAVPEPATWAMMIGGFGLIGASLRRRAVRVAFAR